MFQLERMQKIRQILIAKKSVSVIDLSGIFNVSEITIRRDFEKLEKDGFLQRTHGGAILNPRYQEERPEVPSQSGPYALPQLSIPPLKEELGRLCVDIVEDYDVVFLGRCPSALAMARQLHQKTDVVVVTSSIEIMLELSIHKANRVILTGGRVDFDRWTLQTGSGGVSSPAITVNKAFLHAQGIDFEGGVTMNDHEDMLLYQQLQQHTSGDIILVVEGALFGKVGLYKADELANITAIVTDSSIPDDYKAWLYRRGVKIYQKFDL